MHPAGSGSSATRLRIQVSQVESRWSGWRSELAVDRLNTSADLAAPGQITSLDNSSSLVLQGDGDLDTRRSTGAARRAVPESNGVSAPMQGVAI